MYDRLIFHIRFSKCSIRANIADEAEKKTSAASKDILGYIGTVNLAVRLHRVSLGISEKSFSFPQFKISQAVLVDEVCQT